MNTIETPKTVSIETFKSVAPQFGPAGIRRLALITVVDKTEVIFSDEMKAAPKYDGANEILGATNLGDDFVIVGRQRSHDDLEVTMTRYEAVKATIPNPGQTMACTAIVDETLDDIVYELYNDSGEAIEIEGLENTELVDQKLQIQGFAFDGGDKLDVFVGNFQRAVEGFQSGDYVANLKFITTAPKDTRLVRMDGKVALKYPDGKMFVYNLDGKIDEDYFDLPKIPEATMVLQTIDENGNFTQGWTVAKYFGDEDIESYVADAANETDEELKRFLDSWNNTPMGKAHAAPETYRAK